MTDLYLEWAQEIIKFLEDEGYRMGPVMPRQVDVLLRDKLKADLEDCIVYEWFCSDCDYRRRCDG